MYAPLPRSFQLPVLPGLHPLRDKDATDEE
jgi:hypothetical protein